MRKICRKRRNRHENGSTILESLLCMIIICLVLFGLMQFFYVMVAQMLTDYAAFYTARSKSVGFADYLSDRAGRVASIGASGPIINAIDLQNNTGSYSTVDLGTSFSNPLSQLSYERATIPEYIQGIRRMDYEYWGTAGDPVSYTDFNDNNGQSSSESHADRYNTTLEISTNDSGSMITGNVVFNDYPLRLEWMSSRKAIEFMFGMDRLDVSGSAQITNHAEKFLE